MEDKFSEHFKKSKEYDLIEVWHYLMLSYGYIPFDDFLNLDAGIKDKLITLLNEKNKKENEIIEHSRRGR